MFLITFRNIFQADTQYSAPFLSHLSHGLHNPILFVKPRLFDHIFINYLRLFTVVKRCYQLIPVRSTRTGVKIQFKIFEKVEEWKLINELNFFTGYITSNIRKKNRIHHIEIDSNYNNENLRSLPLGREREFPVVHSKPHISVSS